MFFKGLPKELLKAIIEFMPSREIVRLTAVAKEDFNVSRDDDLWRKSGAKNFEEFKARMTALPKDRKEQVFSYHYTLDEAEMLSLSLEERISNFFTSEQQALFMQNTAERERDPDDDMYQAKLKYVCSDYGTLALYHHMIETDEELSRLTTDQVYYLFKNEGGYSILRDGLLSLGQIASLDGDKVLRHVATTHGFQALKEGFITYENMVGPNRNVLEFLLTKNGIKALREGLITFQQAALFNPLYGLKGVIDNEHSFKALQERKFTIEDAANCSYYFGRHVAGNPRGLHAFEKGLFTATELARLETIFPFLDLISDEGLTVWEHGLMTLDEAAGMNGKERKERIHSLYESITVHSARAVFVNKVVAFT